MSKAGWYPDPGGQQGMFRWWDGTQWTPQLTAHPYAGPPQADPTQPFASPEATVPLPMQDADAARWQQAYADQGPQRSGRGPIAVLVLVGVLLIALLFGAMTLLGGGRLGPFGGGEQPASNPTGNVCPPKREITPEDVKAVAHAVLDHRISIKPELWMSATGGHAVVTAALGQVPVPGSRTGASTAAGPGTEHERSAASA